jgi:hypothetical protein
MGMTTHWVARNFKCNPCGHNQIGIGVGKGCRYRRKTDL